MKAFSGEEEVYSSAIGGGAVGLVDFPFSLSSNASSVTLSFYGINSQLPPTYLNGLVCVEDSGLASFTATCTQGGTLIRDLSARRRACVYICVHGRFF